MVKILVKMIQTIAIHALRIFEIVKKFVLKRTSMKFDNLSRLVK